MSKTLYDYCIELGDDTFLRQWDNDKNGDLTPRDVTSGSGKKVWWRCDKGHSWQTVVKNRVKRGHGCPICSGKQTVSGLNDLTTTHPAVATEWHPTLNGELTPQMVAAGSHKKVWWRCSNGHTWEANISNRAYHGKGCPICTRKLIIPCINDLASLLPEIAAEWHPIKNGDLTPQNVAPYANKRVWWVCDKGHEYIAIVSKRTSKGTKCPYCAGQKVLAGFNDLETVKPGLAEEWYYELNGELTPQMVTVGSHKKVWWRCDEGHVWQAPVYTRAGKAQTGCPVCARKVSTRKNGYYAEIMKSKTR